MTFLARTWRPLLFILLGIGAVLAAHEFLHVCHEHGHYMTLANGREAPMRCYWSERAFQGVGAMVAFIGVAMLLFRDSVRGLSLAAAGAGVLMINIPLWLVPTCGNANMVCNLSFKPGALIFGGIVTLAGLIASFQLQRIDQTRSVGA